MNAVIYARYSSERQTEQSIEGQIRECKEYADNNNINVIGTYIDRAKTGRNDDRDDFQRMLTDSKKKAFDTVIVWKIDRFGRNREDIAKNKAILRRNGVTVLSAKEHIPDGPEGIILEGLLESLAEYYSAELQGKIVRGMRESAYKCQFNGSGMPLGYCVDKEHKFHIDPDGEKIVRLIFDMYDDGNTVATIRKTLNARGIKTRDGKEFTHFAVGRILRNRRYIGEYSWSDIVIPGGMPRIISDEQFERVQAELNKNKKAPARKRGVDEAFLLTGKVFCGHCKGTMCGDSGKGKSGNTFYYYSCINRKNRRKCKKKSVRKEWLETEVVQLTVDNVLRDEVIEHIADRVVGIQQKERDDVSMIDYLNGRLADVETSIKNIMKAIEAGIITETTGARLRELEADREDIKTDIAREELARPIIDRKQIVFFLRQFQGGDPHDKDYQRQIIDLFVNKVIVHDDHIVIIFNYSGEDAEITVELADEAATEALSECSDKLSSGPPKRKSRISGFFFLYFSFFSLRSSLFPPLPMRLFPVKREERKEKRREEKRREEKRRDSVALLRKVIYIISERREDTSSAAEGGDIIDYCI